MTNWYYVKQGEQQGPVSGEQLQAFISSGEVDLETLVWNETMDNWEPASLHFSASVPSRQSDTASASRSDNAQSGHSCNECGMTFPEGELSLFGGKPTCRRCLGKLEQKARAQAGQRSRSQQRPVSTSSGDNNMALIGFVLSIIGFLGCCGILAIPGFICSFIGYQNADNFDNDRKGLALAGMIIAAISLLGGLIMIPFFVTSS